MTPNEMPSDDHAPKPQPPATPDEHDAPEEPERPYAAARLEVEALRAMVWPVPPPAPENQDDDAREPPA